MMMYIEKITEITDELFISKKRCVKNQRHIKIGVETQSSYISLCKLIQLYNQPLNYNSGLVYSFIVQKNHTHLY